MNIDEQDTTLFVCIYVIHNTYGFAHQSGWFESPGTADTIVSVSLSNDSIRFECFSLQVMWGLLSVLSHTMII